MSHTYQIVILDNDNEEVRTEEFHSSSADMIEVLFEYECHCMSPYLDELTEDEDNSELTDELTRIRNNTTLSTTIVGNTAFRICDDETGWVVCSLLK